MGTFVAAIVGLLVGSVLNLGIERLPTGASWREWRWQCPACGRVANAFETAPAVGFFVARGRCPSCGVSWPRRRLVVELCTAALFVVLWLRFGLVWETVVAATYVALFVMILFIDLEHRLIPNRLVYPAVILAMAIAPFWPELSITRALVGGALGFVIMLVPGALGGMGGGDVKLAGLIGIMVGFPLIFVALVIAMLLGGVFAALVLVTGKKGRKDTIAYGPFLAVAGITTLLYGQLIWDWYVGRMLG